VRGERDRKGGRGGDGGGGLYLLPAKPRAFAGWVLSTSTVSCIEDATVNERSRKNIYMYVYIA